MIFRLHSTIAVLLFPALLCAQTSPSAAKPQSSKPAASSAGGPYATMSKAAKQRGEQVFKFFNDGQTGALWASFDEGVKKKYGTEAKFAAQTKSLREHLGTEKKVTDETLVPMLLSPGTLYSRLSDFNSVNVQVITNIGINEHGQVDAFQVGPAQTPSLGRFGGYKDQTKLKLPFGGEWLVDQGGRSVYQNQNLMSDDQRFSVDFVLLKNGRPFSGDGGDNSDYYCFGQPVLAPADGLVVEVEDGYQDNPPGRPTSDSPRGNLILISHGNSEFSLVDHLKQNSVKVKKGDKVKQGDAVAECGNSGPTPAPHIHYMLQNSAGLPLPDSLPAQFVGYIADGKLVDVGEPVRGQIVGNAPAGAAPAASTGQPGSKTPPGSK
jgi:Peptidase family M23